MYLVTTDQSVYWLANVSLLTFDLSRRSEGPWQKRWVTFNGSELKYFKNQSDKDKLSRNIVPLQEMIDIKKVNDVSWRAGVIDS